MKPLFVFEAALAIVLSLFSTSCERKVNAQEKAGDTAPVVSLVVPDFNSSHFTVEHAERFAIVTAAEHVSSPDLNVTGVVSPDVSRQVPVPSLASGKVVEIDARLGDVVKKGQLLFKVRSTDISGAYSDYRKAVKNEQLTKVQLDRARLLYEHGAVPKSQVEVAQNAEDDAMVDLDTSLEHLRLLGSDPDHPTGVVAVYAPVPGVITDQEITNASGVQALTPPNPFTISDASHVWIVCDVYENDLAQVHLGEFADIHLNAWPDRVLKARIGNIGEIMDPNIRTAKVRLEIANPGIMRFGMFATATFRGLNWHRNAMVPAAAVLHLDDRDWVYRALGNNAFGRVQVAAGNMLPGNMQELTSGINPGDRVVADALDLQHEVSEQ